MRAEHASRDEERSTALSPAPDNGGTRGLPVTPAPVRRFPTWALLAGAVLFFAGLWPQMGSGWLWHHDEVLTGERSREMLLAGDPWVVRLNGKPNFHKPPAQYWLTAGLMRLTGSPERAVRLPSVLAAALCLLGTALLGRLVWPDDPWAGPAAAVALAGCGFWLHFARMGMLDAGAALSVVVALWGTELARRRGGGRGWWLAAGAATLGGWQKAPYALGAWVVALLGRVRDGELAWAPTRWPRALRAALATTLVLLLVWPGLQVARFGWVAVVQGQSDSTGNLFNLNKSEGFQPWLYLWWLVRDWAAFGVLAPVAVVAALWREVSRRDPFRREAGAMVALGWGVVACLPYRTERYLIFLLPLAALLVVRFLRRDAIGLPRRHGGLLLALAVASTVPVGSFHYLRKFPDRGDLHTAAGDFGAAGAADPAAVLVVDRALDSGINVPYFVLFYGDLRRPALILDAWSERAVVRSERRQPGERFVGISRGDHFATPFGPTREISRHGEWVVWEARR